AGHRRRRPQLRRRARPRDGLARAHRRRQDHDHADDARPDRARLRHRHLRGQALLRPEEAVGDRRRRAGRRGLPPGLHRPRPPAPLRPDGRIRQGPGGGGRRPDRGVGVRRPCHARPVHRHAPAAQPGHRAARRPPRAAARRAEQRPRPRGHRVAARIPARPGRRGPHRPGVQPRAHRGRKPGRPRRGDPRRPAGPHPAGGRADHPRAPHTRRGVPAPHGRFPMTALVAAEWLRLKSSRLWLWGLLGAVGSGLLIGLAALVGPENFNPPMPGLDTEQGTRALLGLLGFTVFVPALFGTTAVAGEYRHRTVTTTALFAPRRWTWLVAKLAAYTAAGLAYGLLAAAVAGGSIFGAAALKGVT